MEGGTLVNLLDCWDRVRMQLRCDGQSTSDRVMRPVPVMAVMPSDKLPYGYCNFVLVGEDPCLNLKCFRGKKCPRIPTFWHLLTCLKGHFAAQVRLSFQPLFPEKKQRPEILAYVEPLQPAQGSLELRGTEFVHVPEKFSGLYKVRPIVDKRGSRFGVVINITDIWRPVDLVPAFDKRCPANWSADTAVNRAENLYVNTFFDKAIHRAFI